MPHRLNIQLKPHTFPTYEQFYKSASVELLTHPGLLMPVRATHQKKFEKHSNEVDKALDQLQQQGPPENVWTAFAPEIEVDHLECIAEREDINPDDDDIPEYQILEHGDGVVPQIEAPQLSIEFARKLFGSLNETYSTLSASGVKSVCGVIIQNLFFTLYQVVVDLSVPAVLLSAFTGTAAFNISGRTLHSILKLPRNLKPPYQGLGNALDELRARLHDVEILIIDEVSMIYKDLFAHVNWRFQQIKGSKKPFGGISVLAVDDFHQLPPLGKAKPLCENEDDVLDF